MVQKKAPKVVVRLRSGGNFSREVVLPGVAAVKVKSGHISAQDLRPDMLVFDNEAVVSVKPHA